MQFLFPYFLFAGLAIAIPIIIHLFYFRRYKEVYFTNVRFLKEVKEESSARSKLRNLLVLMARCLAILALVLAFAQPYFPQAGDIKKGEKAVSVFVDNSFSMKAMSQDIPLLEVAKQRAKEIVGAYSADDRFQIITNDMEGRHLHLVSKDDAVNLIEEIKISPASQSFHKIVQKQIQTLNSSTTANKSAFLISDFQKNQTDLNQLKDTTVEINLVPLASVKERNIAIDSCWFLTPVQMLKQPNKLLVKIKNYSNEKAENVRLSLDYEGENKPVGSIELAPNEESVDTVNITPLKAGWHQANLILTDYPIQFDDSYYFTFFTPSEINILVINENQPNRFVDAALSGAGIFKVTNTSSKNIDYSNLGSYRMIILNGVNDVSSGLISELKQFTEKGGNVVVFPSGSINLNSYSNFLSTFNANSFLNFEAVKKEVGTLNTNAAIFSDVFDNFKSNLRLPQTSGSYKVNGGRAEERLLSFRDGGSFMSQYRQDKGNLFVCAAPLDESYSNLVKNAEIFVPLLYKMALSTNKSRQLAYIIGKDDAIEEDNMNTSAGHGEKNYKLKGNSGEFIPQQKSIASRLLIHPKNQVKEAGIYNLTLSNDSILSKYAFNFDRKESDLQFLYEKDLNALESNNLHIIGAAKEADFTSIVTDKNQGITLWKWCIILALLFLAIEALLLRFWKV